jgi:glycosyltransferase involved in cell wall biosynthesis
VELVVVGSGMDQHDSIEGTVLELINKAKAVTFFNVTSQPEKFFQACDVLLLPSEREGQPNVLMEMLACANPVIGSDIAGIRELVVDNVNGFTFPVNDQASFINYIRKLVIDCKLRKTLGESGRRGIVAIKSIDFISKQYLDIYSKLKKKGVKYVHESKSSNK